MHERVAGIDVHKDMIKVAVRCPGQKRGTRKTEVLEFRTYFGVLQSVAQLLRLEHAVTHVAMEASGVYTDPVYYAMLEQPFEEVLVVNPNQVKAVKGHKTDARDCRRLAELLECGLLRGSFMPSPEQREMRDLTRYRSRQVQARTSETARLGKTLESAGVKLGSVMSDLNCQSGLAIAQSLADGERRAQTLAGLALGTLRQAGKQADLKMAVTARFTDHHGMLCRMHLKRIREQTSDIGELDDAIADMAASRWQQAAGLLQSVPGIGPAVSAVWLGEIGPEPHRWFSSHAQLASFATLCPGNNISAGKRRYSRTGHAGRYLKPALIQAAWNAIRVRGRLQARYNRLVRRFGGPKNPAAKKKAITAIAHTLLKIIYQVLKSGQPYRELGEDFYTRRQNPASRQDWLLRQLQDLNPGAAITITPQPGGTAQNTAPPGAAPPGAAPPARAS